MPTYRRLIIAWFFVPMHRLLFRLSGGRILGRLEGQGVLVLVTRGRRSGKLRSSRLMYFQFEAIVRGRSLIAQGLVDRFRTALRRGCLPGPTSAWYLNIAADPNVSIETTGERFAADARITQGEERAALFDKVVAANSRFAAYRAGTDRHIPVVALRRA